MTDPSGYLASSDAKCPGGRWYSTGVYITSYAGVGIEMSWTSYKCIGAPFRCQGTTVTFLGGTPTLDLSAGAQAGLVGNAPDASYIEGEFAGFDVSASPGLGFGFSAMFWQDTIALAVSPGVGMGFHIAAADSWTFDLDCQCGY